MATEGYDPYWKLAQLYFSKEDPTDEEVSWVKGVATTCCEERETDKSRSLVSFFMHRMADDPRLSHYLLGIHQADLADSLLECVNPYQSWNPFTMPDSVDTRMGGLYDHFKGGVYVTRGFSSWSSGERVVEYTSLLFGTHHTRLLSQWCEVVKWPDGKYRSRFVKRNDPQIPPPFKVPSPTHALT